MAEDTMVARRYNRGGSQSHAEGGLIGGAAQVEVTGHPSSTNIEWWGEGVRETVNIQVEDVRQEKRRLAG